MRTLLTVLFFAFLAALPPAPAGAQDGCVSDAVFDDYLNPIKAPSFAGLPGLSFSSSVGFLYSSDGRSGSDGSGFYMGHFNYDLGSGITLRWDVGLRSSMVGPETGGNPEFILPNVELTYKPSDRFTMRLQFGQYGYASRRFMMNR